MDEVFENFVVRALREELALSESVFPQGAKGRQLHLDKDRFLGLRPDLSWWEGHRCVFVGDAKYKRTPDTAGVKNADIYQLLAYATATGLQGGMVVYAKGQDTQRTYQIPGADKKLVVRTIDLDADPDDVLEQVRHLASSVRAMRAGTRAPTALAA
jgi:5-methylcytosine-specific restriction enzyme subunit McrC